MSGRNYGFVSRFPEQVGKTSTHYESCYKSHPACAYHLGTLDERDRFTEILECLCSCDDEHKCLACHALDAAKESEDDLPPPPELCRHCKRFEWEHRERDGACLHLDTSLGWNADSTYHPEGEFSP